MSIKKLSKTVTGCLDCPFAIVNSLRPAAYCGLHKKKLSIIDTVAGNTKDPAPAFCPLLAGPANVTLANGPEPRKPGRPLPVLTAGREFAAEVAHFLTWLQKVNGLACPATFFAQTNPYGSPLKIHHLRRALDGSRPFHEAELDTLVRYAAAEMSYKKPLPNPQTKPNE